MENGVGLIKAHARDNIDGLELKPGCNLSGTGTQAASDVTEGVRSDVAVWVGEVGVVEDVGEGAFHAQVEVLEDLESLREAGVQIDVAGTRDTADAIVAEAADGQWVFCSRSGVDRGAVRVKASAGVASHADSRNP